MVKERTRISWTNCLRHSGIEENSNCSASTEQCQAQTVLLAQLGSSWLPRWKSRLRGARKDRRCAVCFSAGAWYAGE